MARMKFLCDAERCIECNGCVTACNNEHDVPDGINRRHVVTLRDGERGEKSISVACMHCTDAPCAAVCPVDCFYTHSRTASFCTTRSCASAAATVFTPVRSAHRSFLNRMPSTRAARWINALSAPAARRPDNSVEEYLRYGRNRIAEGKLPLCAEMCSTKALLAGDGNQVSDIYRKRIVNAAAGPTSGVGEPPMNLETERSRLP